MTYVYSGTATEHIVYSLK